MEQTAVFGMNALLGNMSSFGRRAQAIAGEFAKMSEENLAASSKAAERLRGATSLQEVAAIQTDLVRESLECASDHYRKIAEIAASAPQDFARGYSEMMQAATDAGQEAVKRATDNAREMKDQAAQVIQRTADAARNTAEGVQRASRT
jgi:hypothetical protein